MLPFISLSDAFVFDHHLSILSLFFSATLYACIFAKNANNPKVSFVNRRSPFLILFEIVSIKFSTFWRKSSSQSVSQSLFYS